MMSRISFLAAVAIIALAGPLLLAADDKMHEVTVVKVEEGKIILTLKGEEKKHTHDVAKDAKITLDDKKVKLEELKEGFTAKIMMDDKFVITMIEAKGKKK